MAIAPDFRYYTKERDKQLIVEAKGTPKPIGQRDRDQAKRYFMYFQQTGCEEAVISFVRNPEVWLTWLTNIAQQNGILFGVVDLDVQVVPKVAYELLHVVGQAHPHPAMIVTTHVQIRRPIRRMFLQPWRSKLLG